MNKTIAARIINAAAVSRDAAYRRGMDWLPSPTERAELREAVALAPGRLSRLGRELYEQYAEAAYRAAVWEEKAR